MRSEFRLLKATLGFFDRATRTRLYLIGGAIAVLSLVDTVALVLIALVASTAVTSGDASAVTLPSGVRQFTDILGLGSSVPFAAVLTAIFVLMLGKTIVGAVLTRRSLVFLAGRDIELGGTLIDKQLSVPWLVHVQRDQGETLRDALWGPTVVVQEFVGSALFSWAEMSTIAAVALAVLLAQPLVAVAGGTYLVALAIVLQHSVRRRTSLAGEHMTSANAVVTRSMLQALRTYKELLVKRRASAYGKRICAERREFAGAYSEMIFVATLTRYVLEAGLVLGIGVIAVVALAVGGAESVAASVVLFVTAGFRTLPALHKLQLNIANLRFRAPHVRAIERELAATARDPDSGSGRDMVGAAGLVPLRGHLALRGLSVRYPGSAHAALRDVCVEIPQGRRVALVGMSGSGKTTLADAILGLLPIEPKTVTVGGIDIMDVLPQWRHSIGYVPQDVVIVDDSVAANVALGWSGDEIDVERVWWALDKAQADDFVRALPEGVNSLLGDAGTMLAGGQRQRLGIARALYSRPTFLVLDEATSALDVETEHEVMAAIASLHGDVTVLVIAHRLSTVRSADLVLYLEEGILKAQGKFEDVVREEPRFAQHAQLSGLT